MKVVTGRISLALAMLAAFFFMTPSNVGAANGAAPAKVQVCHKGRVISVGPVAALWHVLIHGDKLGACEVDPPDGGLGTGTGI